MNALNGFIALIRNFILCKNKKKIQNYFEKKDFENNLKNMSREELLSTFTSNKSVLKEESLNELMFIKLDKEFYICYEYLSVLILDMILNKEYFVKKHYNYDEQKSTIHFPIDIIDLFMQTLSLKYEYQYIENKRMYKTFRTKTNDQINFKMNITKVPDKIANILKNKFLFTPVEVVSYNESVKLELIKINFKSFIFRD